MATSAPPPSAPRAAVTVGARRRPVVTEDRADGEVLRAALPEWPLRGGRDIEGAALVVARSAELAGRALSAGVPVLCHASAPTPPGAVAFASAEELVVAAEWILDRLAGPPPPPRADLAERAWLTAIRAEERRLQVTYRPDHDALLDRPEPAATALPTRSDVSAAPGDTRGPLVSLIIPTRDRPDLVELVLESIRRTRWPRLEVVLVDNGSVDARARAILARTHHRVVRAPIPFNFPRLVTLGAATARGSVLVLLNNDIEVTDPDWLAPLVAELDDPTVGVAGALLRYPDGTTQHCGVAIEDGVPTHVLHGLRPGSDPRIRTRRECVAVTGACLAVRADTFWALDGLDPVFERDYNDIDFCLRVRQAGLRVVYTPAAELVHHESASRGREPNPDVAADWLMFRTRWARLLAESDTPLEG